MVVFSEHVPVTVEKDTAFPTLMMHYAVADPDLLIRGGGGGGGGVGRPPKRGGGGGGGRGSHSDPKIGGRGAVSKKYFFGPSGLSLV